MRIVRVATMAFVVLHHLAGQIRASMGAGHEVILISSPDAGSDRLGSLGASEVVLVPIPREIEPFADLVALIRLWRQFRRLRPDIVHSITPKAGLLTALAARVCGVRIRLHTFTGQAWVERKGPVRWLGRMADRVITLLNTRCYADSFSQRDFLESERLCRPGSIRVLGAGSLSGVPLERFDPVRLEAAASKIRAGLLLSENARVILFVGRVTRDKGIVELVDAFRALQPRVPGATLLLVGPLEPERDPLPEATLAEIGRNPGIHALGYVANPEHYMAASDVFCLPSYREGFGIVAIEAAALGLPCVGTRIVGLSDAVVDGATGLLVPPKDARSLAAALENLLRDDALRARLGAAARERVAREFDESLLNAKLVAEYTELAAQMKWDR